MLLGSPCAASSSSYLYDRRTHLLSSGVSFLQTNPELWFSFLLIDFPWELYTTSLFLGIARLETFPHKSTVWRAAWVQRRWHRSGRRTFSQKVLSSPRASLSAVCLSKNMRCTATGGIQILEPANAPWLNSSKFMMVRKRLTLPLSLPTTKYLLPTTNYLLLMLLRLLYP